ncbi:MAG TPA: transposase [Methylococcaceae bacterium]|nr:transposase [Methylococcaceae bacterium]
MKPIKTHTQNMTNYRRHKIKGGVYFFTVNLAERQKTLLTDHVAALRESFRLVKTAHPFSVDAVVILPDHLHAIWTLPEGDDDFSLRWRQIKSAFSRSMENGERLSESRTMKAERGIWQRRFWEHAIRDETDYAAHVDYIHYNPVKHGHVEHVVDWPHSSFHRFVRAGVYPSNWAGCNIQHMDIG